MSDALEYEIDMRRRRLEYSEHLRAIEKQQSKLFHELKAETDRDACHDLTRRLIELREEHEQTHKLNYFTYIEIKEWKRDQPTVQHKRPV
jgi:hypothetical protein